MNRPLLSIAMTGAAIAAAATPATATHNARCTPTGVSVDLYNFAAGRTFNVTVQALTRDRTVLAERKVTVPVATNPKYGQPGEPKYLRGHLEDIDIDVPGGHRLVTIYTEWGPVPGRDTRETADVESGCGPLAPPTKGTDQAEPPLTTSPTAPVPPAVEIAPPVTTPVTTRLPKCRALVKAGATKAKLRGARCLRVVGPPVCRKGSKRKVKVKRVRRGQDIRFVVIRTCTGKVRLGRPGPVTPRVAG